MAIGDTVQAGLMRVDSSPILLAGQAQAQANKAFGNAVTGVIDKFYQKKKDKQERDEREQAYLKMGLTSVLVRIRCVKPTHASLRRQTATWSRKLKKAVSERTCTIGSTSWKYTSHP